MKKKLIFLLLGLTLAPILAHAQSVEPRACYVDKDGFNQEAESISDGQAPLEVTFRANPSNMDDYSPSYEWHFYKVSSTEGPQELFVRYEEDTQYTFTESGSYNIVLKTKLDQEGNELGDKTITISIAESVLVFPNAFSPNLDGANETFKAKEVRSIVSFKGMIINRYGQKIYSTTDPEFEWDGTFNGRPVKEGVYFLHVVAKGADGKDYHIRKDINLLRGHRDGGGTSSGSTNQQ